MNLSPTTVWRLRTDGFKAERVNDILPASADDTEILRVAENSEYVLITFDLDFSALLAVEGKTKPSLISLRLTYADPDLVARRLLHVLPLCMKDLENGCIVTVEDNAIRTRLFPRK